MQGMSLSLFRSLMNVSKIFIRSLNNIEVFIGPLYFLMGLFSRRVYSISVIVTVNEIFILFYNWYTGKMFCLCVSIFFNVTTYLFSLWDFPKASQYIILYANEDVTSISSLIILVRIANSHTFLYQSPSTL